MGLHKLLSIGVQIRPGEWRAVVSEDGTSGALRSLPFPRGTRYSTVANEACKTMKEYFNSDHGSVPWQWNTVRSREVNYVVN